MHPKTLSTLERLQHWLNRIIDEGKRRDWLVSDFVSAQDFSSFQQFYNELIIHVKSIQPGIKGMDRLVNDYVLMKRHL